MQNYILRLIMFCLALTCRNITWADPVLTGRTITTGDGLPSNLVHDIAQDSQGYIWMATPNGLCRYSFVNFETIGCAGREVSKCQCGNAHPRYRQQLALDPICHLQPCLL